MVQYIICIEYRLRAGKPWKHMNNTQCTLLKGFQEL